MRKGRVWTIGLVAVIAVSSVMAGCSFGVADYSHIEGYEQVVRAQKLYSELDSGHFYVQNNTTEEKTSEFTFKYREDGKLAYMYMASDEEGLYLEYHNGSEINLKQNGQKEWSFVPQGDENYYSYSKEEKHPFTSEGVISMNVYAVTEGAAEKDGDGEKIRFQYNAEAFADSFEGMGTIKSFESTVWLNEEGYCWRLDQKGIFEKNGGENVYDYSMFIDEMNEVEKVERIEG